MGSFWSKHREPEDEPPRKKRKVERYRKAATGAQLVETLDNLRLWLESDEHWKTDPRLLAILYLLRNKELDRECFQRLRDQVGL